MKLKTMMLPAMLIVLIASTVVVHVVMLIVASRDPSFAVADDADRDGDWAATMRQRRENTRLGWTIDADLRAPVAPGAPALLTVDLADAAGQPLRGAVVRIEAFHKARPNAVVELAVGERAAGRYVGALMPPQPGFWRISLSASRDAALFTEDLDVELETEPAARGEEGAS